VNRERHEWPTALIDAGRASSPLSPIFTSSGKKRARIISAYSTHAGCDRKKSRIGDSIGVSTEVAKVAKTTASRLVACLPKRTARQSRRTDSDAMP
jgi:hypothetical protein